MHRKQHINEPETIPGEGSSPLQGMSRREAMKAAIAGSTLLAAGKALSQPRTAREQITEVQTERKTEAMLYRYGGEFGDLKPVNPEGV